MTLKRSVYNTIKDGIESGNYKRVRLVELKGEDRIILVPYNSFIKPSGSIERLDYIKFQLEKKLPPGTYIVEVSTGATNNAIQDSFQVVKHPLIKISASGQKEEQVIDKTNEQEIMQEYDLDEIKQLYKENAELRAINEMLEFKIKILEESKPTQELREENVGASIVKTISENLVPGIALLDEYLKTKKAEIKLGHRKLALAESGKMPVKKNGNGKKKSLDFEEIAEELEELQEEDEAKFNKKLDFIEKTNKKLYAFLLERLELEELDDDEDEEEEEDEDEDDENEQEEEEEENDDEEEEEEEDEDDQ